FNLKFTFSGGETPSGEAPTEPEPTIGA
ncbi:MAG: hypothetical protein RIQ79_2467, partial [Verrucomicrobiota bacterium]